MSSQLYVKEWREYYRKMAGIKRWPSEDLIRTFHAMKRKGLISEKMNVIDIGCGNARFWPFLKEMGFKDITGVDIVSDAFQLYPASEFHQTNEFINVDFLELDRTFDIVIAYGVIDHVTIELSERYIEKIYDILNEWGICYLSVKVDDDCKDYRSEINPYPSFEAGIPHTSFNECFLASLIESKRFKIEGITRTSFKNVYSDKSDTTCAFILRRR